MFRVSALATAVFALSCGVSGADIGSGPATDTTEDELRKRDPCAVVRCMAGTHCVAKGRNASCVPDAAACTTDADCRLFDNYCDGCACQALPVGAPDPVCTGTQVQCFAQPCAGKTATCQAGTCVVSDGTSGTPCGNSTCNNGDVCCNASCGICTPPGYYCTQQACL